MDGGFRQAHLGERKGLRCVGGMYPSHHAQKHVTVSSQIKDRPHLVALVCRSEQELVCLPLAGFAQVEYPERRQRRGLP